MSYSKDFINQRQKENQEMVDREKASQTATGVHYYTWSTSNDERVCKTCNANHGKVFSWAVTPKHGHAGACTDCDMGFCRCVPLPYTKHLFDKRAKTPEQVIAEQNKNLLK